MIHLSVSVTDLYVESNLLLEDDGISVGQGGAVLINAEPANALGFKKVQQNSIL